MYKLNFKIKIFRLVNREARNLDAYKIGNYDEPDPMTSHSYFAFINIYFFTLNIPQIISYRHSYNNSTLKIFKGIFLCVVSL